MVIRSSSVVLHYVRYNRTSCQLGMHPILHEATSAFAIGLAFLQFSTSSGRKQDLGRASHATLGAHPPLGPGDDEDGGVYRTEEGRMKHPEAPLAPPQVTGVVGAASAHILASHSKRSILSDERDDRALRRKHSHISSRQCAGGNTT